MKHKMMRADDTFFFFTRLGRPIRVVDLQSALNLQRSDIVDVKWIQRNWNSWQINFEKSMGAKFCGLRSLRSVKALHLQNPDVHAESAVGESCMEEWTFSFLVILWWLIRMFKTMGNTTSEAVAEKGRVKKLFCNMLELCFLRLYISSSP